MFEGWMAAYEAFQENGGEDSFLETLRLADLALNGALRAVDPSHLGVELADLARKRRDGVPLEYIVGRAAFMKQLFFCSPDTLIPREETELLVRVALDTIKQMQRERDALTIMDIGTGSGNIAVSLALFSENTSILASDISPEAIEVARKNVEAFGLQERVEVHCGDLFAPFHGSEHEGAVDMVVCNPPYLPTSTMEKLAAEIIDHEPKVALDAGTYGIAIFRRLITDAAAMLRPAGILVFEIGAGQHELVTRLLSRNPNYHDISYFDDGEQIRVVSASTVARD